MICLVELVWRDDVMNVSMDESSALETMPIAIDGQTYIVGNSLNAADIVVGMGSIRGHWAIIRSPRCTSKTVSGVRRRREPTRIEQWQSARRRCSLAFVLGV